MALIVVHVSVAGDQISACSTAFAVSKLERSVPPPVATTEPSGRAVRFMNARGNAIDPVGRHAGLGAVMSSR